MFLNKILAGLITSGAGSKFHTAEKNLSTSICLLAMEAANTKVPGLQIYQDQRQVLHNGVEVFLSPLEFDTLIYLARQPGRVFTKDQIYQHVYQEEPAGDVNNIIYCLIRSLRKKLEKEPRNPRYIHTVRGVGYKFEALPEE